MKVSYEGIGQWAATFACQDTGEGEIVRISGSGEVSACQAGEDFCGVVLFVSRGGDACTVALGGMATAKYSGGSAPVPGWCGLVADGDGGVSVDAAGTRRLVAAVDEAAKTVTFVL